MADIMFIGAHPDDIEFVMGGTALKLAKKYSTVMVVLTKGEMGTRGSPLEREKEVKDAASFIGAELELLDFKDCHIHDDGPSRLKIANVIRKHKPKIVFCPYFEHKTFHRDGISHPDHSATGTLVKYALRFAKFKKITLDYEPHNAQRLVYYMVPRTKMPTFVSDVSQVIEDWKNLAKKHKSQATDKLLDRLLHYRKTAGAFIGVEYGETFLVEEPLEMDSEYLFRM